MMMHFLFRHKNPLLAGMLHYTCLVRRKLYTKHGLQLHSWRVKKESPLTRNELSPHRRYPELAHGELRPNVYTTHHNVASAALRPYLPRPEQCLQRESLPQKSLPCFRTYAISKPIIATPIRGVASASSNRCACPCRTIYPIGAGQSF